MKSPNAYCSNKMYGNTKNEDHHLTGDARYHERAAQPKEERFKFI